LTLAKIAKIAKDGIQIIDLQILEAESLVLLCGLGDLGERISGRR
jgi:hypothetical protein